MQKQSKTEDLLGAARLKAANADPDDIALHVMEDNHQSSDKCWCMPELHFVDPDTGCKVYEHRSTH